MTDEIIKLYFIYTDYFVSVNRAASKKYFYRRISSGYRKAAEQCGALPVTQLIYASHVLSIQLSPAVLNHFYISITKGSGTLCYDESDNTEFTSRGYQCLNL